MSPFPIDAGRLQGLAATRGGRVALAGFEYQRAFALLRLVSMWVGKAVKGSTTEVPALLRYEWAEDIDELAADEAILLAAKMIEVNAVFFTRTVMPRLNEQMGGLFAQASTATVGSTPSST